MENIFIVLAKMLWQLFRPLFSALTPLFTGLLLAWLLSPVTDRLQSRFRPGHAILITYTGLFLILAAAGCGFLVLISGTLPSGSLAETAEVITSYFHNAAETASDFTSKYVPGAFSDSSAAQIRLEQWLAAHFSLESIVAALSSLSGIAVSLFLGVVASVYLLKDRDYFLRLWNRGLSLLLNQKHHGLLNDLLYEIKTVVSAFLKGILIDSLVISLLSSAILSVLNLPFAVVIGIFAGLLNVIPYFGPVIGMIPAFIAGFFQGGLPKSIAAVLALFLIQQIDSNWLYPRIVGSSTGLHPLFILLSVSIFGYFFGLPGMLLAVPAAGIIQIFIRRWAYH